MPKLMRCMNWKVMAGLALVAMLIVLIAPHAAGVVPLLAVLACPLSMAGMMWSMRNSRGRESVAPGSRRAEARIAELKGQIAALEADGRSSSAHVGDQALTR